MKAIILAAGRGSRMGKLTKNNHKSLFKIKGQSLLNKIVQDLRYLKIKDILIVTGYKSNLIKKDVKDKVRFSYFPNYKNTNNLQSLLYVKKELNTAFMFICRPFLIKKLYLYLK